MTEISKGALKELIETLERQLDAARALFKSMYGDDCPDEKPIEIKDDRFADLDPWKAIRKYLREVGGQAEYDQTFEALCAGGSAIKDAAQPRATFAKAVNKGLKFGHFLLNGKSEEAKGKSGDIISLP